MKAWRQAIIAGSVWGLAAGAAGAATLEQCVEAALRDSPDVKSAAHRLEAARAAVREARSAWYPQVGLAGGWTRTDNPPQAFFMALNQRRASLQEDFNRPDDTENVRGGVVGQWRVFDGGRREADHAAALGGALAAEASLAAVRNELAHQVTAAYAGALQARAYAAVQQEAVNSLGESLRVAAARHAAGGALKSDVLNLEVQRSQAREDLIRASNGMALAVAVVNAAVGREFLAAGALEPALPPSLLAVPPEHAQGIEGRPELAAVAAQVRAATARMARARREYYPGVNAFGSVDWDSETLDGFERSYLAGAAVELNLFDGFRNRSGLARARAQLQEAKAGEERLRQALALDLTQARLGEREAAERLAVAGRSLDAATEALRITQERYEQGAAPVTDLLAAQVALTANRMRQATAEYDVVVARSNVRRALGGRAGQAEAKAAK
jgi:outer membrane protein TolC